MKPPVEAAASEPAGIGSDPGQPGGLSLPPASPDPTSTPRPQPGPRAGMPLLLRVPLSVLFWANLLVVGIPCFLLAVFGWLMGAILRRDAQRRWPHFAACLWAWLCLLPMRVIGLWSLELRGREHLPEGGVVLIANHQSQLDILATLATFLPFKWVSKASMAKVPVIGWSMRCAGYIFLERGDAAAARGMLADCRRWLGLGQSVLIFPEGTRSPDGTLQEFKPGAFIVARRADAPIVPMVVRDTGFALRPRSGLLDGPARFTIEILPAVSAGEAAAAKGDELRVRVHGALAAALGAPGSSGPAAPEETAS